MSGRKIIALAIVKGMITAQASWLPKRLGMATLFMAPLQGTADSKPAPIAPLAWPWLLVTFWRSGTLCEGCVTVSERVGEVCLLCVVVLLRGKGQLELEG